MRGSIAERGGVRVGHRIIEINNESVVATTHQHIVELLATTVGEVSIHPVSHVLLRFCLNVCFLPKKRLPIMLLQVPITWYCTCLSHVITLAYHMVLKLPRACFSSVEDVSLLTVLYFSFRSIPTILRENRGLSIWHSSPGQNRYLSNQDDRSYE